MWSTKLLPKLIVERLKLWLSSLIFKERVGFVVGKKILDGVFVAIMAIHSMATFKHKVIFIKLDMVKAYDRVN